MRDVVATVWGVGLSLLLFPACSAVKPATPTPAFVAWSQGDTPGRHVCVLPFTDQTGIDGLGVQVRQSFFGHLSVKRFADAELHEIDARLDSLAGDWKAQPARQVGKALGCDALVYGEVLKASKLYLGVYSQLTLEGAIRLVDTATGRPLVQGSYTTRFHFGGVPLSPLGFVPNAVLNLRHMTDEQMVRAIDDLGRHLADTVPDLPAASPVRRVSTPVLPPPAGPTTIGEVYPEPADTSQESYRVQVASFHSHGEAQQAARLLRDKGYRPAIAEFTGTRRSWHRVVLGPFPSVREARQVGARIQKTLPFTPVVIPTPDH
jgi:hypothetical protein